MFLPQIRFCERGDIPALLDVNGLSPHPWPESAIVGDLADPSVPGTASGGPSYLGAFALSAGSRLLGYAAMGHEDRFALLMGLVVRSEYRRRGIGTQLVLAVAECARSIGRTRLILRVRESNLPARSFYERLAFRRETTCVRYYSDGENAVRMGLPLVPGFPGV